MAFLSRRCNICKTLQPLENFKPTGYKDTISKKCRDCTNNHQRQINPRYRLWQSSYNNAARKGISHAIRPAHIPTPTHCIYLGCELDWSCPADRDGERLWNSPSIDRIDPTLGYVPGNIQVISDLANRMKSNATVEQLILFAEGIRRVHGE